MVAHSHMRYTSTIYIDNCNYQECGRCWVHLCVLFLGVSQLDPILQASYLLALCPQHIRYKMHSLCSDNVPQYLCRSLNDNTRYVRVEKYTYYQLYSPSSAQVFLKHTTISNLLQGK